MTPLGKLVADRLDERGLTYSGGARVCNMAWGSMRDVVEGRVHQPRPDTMARLQRGLDITDDDLRAIGYYLATDSQPVPASELPPALAARAARRDVLHQLDSARPVAEPAVPAPMEGQQSLLLGEVDAGGAKVDLQGWRDWGAEAVLAAAIEHVRSGNAGPSQQWGPQLADRLRRMLDLGEQAEALVSY
jgi:hypothetical protein